MKVLGKLREALEKLYESSGKVMDADNLILLPIITAKKTIRFFLRFLYISVYTII